MFWTLIRVLPLAVLISPALLSPQTDTSKKTTLYRGGISTPIQAILRIGKADGIPIGIVLGKGSKLCEGEIKYDFSGLSSAEALNKVLAPFSIKTSPEDNVINLVDSDIPSEVNQIMVYKFARFSAPPTTMRDLGERLTGYISTTFEGASGFFLTAPITPDFELLTISEITGATVPQIANQIVKLGSRGIWIMYEKPRSIDKSSTIITIFSYHDSSSQLAGFSCPAPA